MKKKIKKKLKWKKVYGTIILLYFIFADWKKSFLSKILPYVLILYAFVITYFVKNNKIKKQKNNNNTKKQIFKDKSSPLYFQVGFATEVLVVIIRNFYIIKKYSPEMKKA